MRLVGLVNSFFENPVVVVVVVVVYLCTFSHANNTGAVASPSFRSAAVGFPISFSLDTKSSTSSTSYNKKIQSQ